jgi:hypothetical protein
MGMHPAANQTRQTALSSPGVIPVVMTLSSLSLQRKHSLYRPSFTC